ncbi:MAG: HMA2 domain-containing protein [Desulfobaccales bacterium]
MSKLENREKKRRALLAGFNNMPQLLAEARRAVDDVTKTVRKRGGGKAAAAAPEAQPGAGAGSQRQKKAVPRGKSPKERGRQKRPSRPPAAKPPPPVPTAAPDMGISGSPQPGWVYCGITVKHAIPGRIRLRLPQMLHNEALAEKLPPLVAAVPGIAAVEASIATGSLLITFSPRELAMVKNRSRLAEVMRRVSPGLETDNLLKRMLGG